MNAEAGFVHEHGSIATVTDPKQPARRGTHRGFVPLFDAYYLGAVYPPDGANRTDTGRRKLGESLIEQFRKRSVGRVLDCAVGTGCPILDIAEIAGREFTIHCCDGDEHMVALFENRTLDRDLDLDLSEMVPPLGRHVAGATNGSNPMVIDWAKLDNLQADYDYVLCRGNALTYADTWTGSETVASREKIQQYLGQMAGRVRPGGYLHVDAPKTARLEKTQRRIIGSETGSVEEEVTIQGARRKWTVTFRRGEEQPVEFTRYSSLLTIDDLQEALDNLGLVETEPVDLEHERKNFGVIIARKPG